MYMCTKLGDGDGQSIEGKQIEEVNEFTYLKSPASKKGGYDEDIQHQQSWDRNGSQRHWQLKPS